MLGCKDFKDLGFRVLDDFSFRASFWIGFL